jgi:hypothetical protein
LILSTKAWWRRIVEELFNNTLWGVSIDRKAVASDSADKQTIYHIVVPFGRVYIAVHALQNFDIVVNIMILTDHGFLRITAYAGRREE